MSVATSVKASPTAADVRAFALAQGITEGYGSRGRIAPTVVEAFNKGKRGTARYAEKAVTKVVEVSVKPEKGRTIVRTVSVEQVRAAARAAGVEVGARGRLPHSVLVSFVLGTLGQTGE